MNLADIVRGAKVAALLVIIVAAGGGWSGSEGASTPPSTSTTYGPAVGTAQARSQPPQRAALSSPSRIIDVPPGNAKGAVPQPVSLLTIESLSVSGLPAPRGGTVDATVVAKDVLGLALTYSWTISGSGWVITGGATSASATITAPDSYTAKGTAAITVTDSMGDTETGTLSLSTVDNEVPVINSLSVSPQPVITSANLAASATDPDGDPLTYAWNIGGIANLLTGPNAVWNSTGIPGKYAVTVTADDGFGGTASASIPMVVSSASPWPRYQRDLGSTGLSPADTSADTGVAKLIFSSGQPYPTSFSPAIGADGTLYVGLANGLYALNPSGVGNPKWIFSVRYASTPAVAADGTIYLGSADGHLYAVNPDGSLKWSFPILGETIIMPPAIGADGTIYIGSAGGLYAVNPDGSLKWSFATDGGAGSPVIGADGTIYITANLTYLYAINPDGTLKWTYYVYNHPLTPALAADGTIYVADNAGVTT